MIRTWTISLILCLWAAPMLAQNVVVRSGEHEGFTRLVLDFPARLDWQDQTREDGITITFPGGRPTFDLSRVFGRLTQGRLARIGAPKGSGQLDLTFGCACTTRTFWHSQSMLVLDILAPGTAEHSAARRLQAPLAEGATVDLREPWEARAESSAARLVASRLAPLSATNKTSAPLGLEDALPAVRRSLLAQIAQSANQGLVQPLRTPDLGNMTRPPQRPLATAIEIVPSDGMATGAEPPLTESLPLATLGNLRVTGTIDQAPGLAFSSALSDAIQTACLPDTVLDVAAWGVQKPLADQIGTLSPRLSGEFDVVNPEVALQLARLYIYFGFGLEARHVASLIPVDAAEISVLLELASLVDDPDAASATPRLKEDLRCNGRSALWAALAHAVIPEDKLLDHSAILRGFAELPEHLRRHLGPALARKLLAAKHRETSDMILRGLGPADLSGTAGANIARAELALAEGDLSAADQSLQGSLSGNDVNSAPALAALINARISRGQDIDYDTAQLAGALYQETRGTPMGQVLGGAYLLALTASRSYAEAFDEFERVSPDLSPENAQKTRQEMLRLLGAEAEDIEFLRQILGEPKESFARMSADLTREIAQRALTLGFADVADDILSVASRSVTEPEQRLLRAEIALAQDLPHLAEAEIIGLASPDADTLRARARTILGDYTGAMRYAEGFRDEAAKQQAAWLAQDWPSLLSAADPSTQNLAQAMTQAAPDEAGGLLQFNQALIDQSIATRSALSALLASTAISDPP
jgi:hypothetical protein